MSESNCSSVSGKLKKMRQSKLQFTATATAMTNSEQQCDREVQNQPTSASASGEAEAMQTAVTSLQHGDGLLEDGDEEPGPSSRLTATVDASRPTLEVEENESSRTEGATLNQKLGFGDGDANNSNGDYDRTAVSQKSRYNISYAYCSIGIGLLTSVKKGSCVKLLSFGIKHFACRLYG